MISYKFKIPGFVLILIGIALTILYYFHKMDWSVPVFAIQSSYLETRYFTIIETNIFEELILLSYFLGFLMTAFSKEKIEQPEYKVLRGKAWQKAVLVNLFILIFGTVFIYGTGFVGLLVFNLVSVFVFFHIFFYFRKRKFRRNNLEEEM